jgi:hypothetical protein
MTRILLSELAAKGDVITCDTIKFEKGKKIEGDELQVGWIHA